MHNSDDAPLRLQVLVVQLNGTKDWELCVPTAKALEVRGCDPTLINGDGGSDDGSGNGDTSCESIIEAEGGELESRSVHASDNEASKAAKVLNIAQRSRLHDVHAWASTLQSAVAVVDAAGQKLITANKGQPWAAVEADYNADLANAGTASTAAAMTSAAPGSTVYLKAPTTAAVYESLDLNDKTWFQCSNFTLQPGDRLYVC